MEAHRLAEARSLAYHQRIAQKIQLDPAIVTKARARVETWHASNPDTFHVRQWRDLLSRSSEAIAAFLCADTELARELRQSTPFAGALSANERWQIWRSVRAAYEG